MLLGVREVILGVRKVLQGVKKVLLGFRKVLIYVRKNLAMPLTGLEIFLARRAARCLKISLKCIDHDQNKRFFPRNPNTDNAREVRE